MGAMFVPVASALKARSVPATVMWFASIDVGTVAQRTPVPDVEPLADNDMKPPGAFHMTADEWMCRVEFRDSGSWMMPSMCCGICESDMLKPPRFDELR